MVFLYEKQAIRYVTDNAGRMDQTRTIGEQVDRRMRKPNRKFQISTVTMLFGNIVRQGFWEIPDSAYARGRTVPSGSATRVPNGDGGSAWNVSENGYGASF